MSEIKLKPCPFCGGEARINIFGLSEAATVSCTNIYQCGATQERFDSPEEAAEAWNRRVRDEQIH